MAKEERKKQVSSVMKRRNYAVVIHFPVPPFSRGNSFVLITVRLPKSLLLHSHGRVNPFVLDNRQNPVLDSRISLFILSLPLCVPLYRVRHFEQCVNFKKINFFQLVNPRFLISGSVNRFSTDEKFKSINLCAKEIVLLLKFPADEIFKFAASWKNITDIYYSQRHLARR